MKNVKIIRINLQESILVSDESLNRVDSVIAMYSEHTNTIQVRDSYWEHNNMIEDHFAKMLRFKKAPIITSCSGFGIEAI
jgi:hypothetical protein